MEDLQARILANLTMAPGIQCLWVDAPNVARSQKPGEFVMADCGKASDPLLRRAISIHRYGPAMLSYYPKTSSSNWITPTSIALLFNANGLARTWLGQREVGDKINMLGPLGQGYEIEPSSRHLVMGGGGTGLAPLIALADQAIASGKTVTMISAAKTATQLYPKSWAPDKVKFVEVTEDGSSGEKGLITDCLPKHIQNADQTFFCGPVPMYRAISTTWKTHDISVPTQVLLEVRMACGFGICYGCAVSTNKGRKMVCTEGPKFDLTEINWDQL